LHVVLTGIRSGDVGVPDLGVSVRPGALVVDYRMGVEWTAEVVAGFVELLRALQQLVEGSELVVADAGSAAFPADTQRRFREAVAQYCD
ncbi:MAG: hypothetical protein M3N47_14810, partial [Chloroflexota bacterium]|nr:hypothetical protein [Chloroflexota bacterium]